MRKTTPVNEITVSIGVKDAILSARSIKELIEAAAETVKFSKQFAVSVSIVGPTKSHALNKQWRGKDKPTNVLSFATRETAEGVQAVEGFQFKTPTEDLGDIILCPAVIRKEAPLFGVSVKDHARRLVIHGFLHLLGHDHSKDHEAKNMELLEAKILRNI